MPTQYKRQRVQDELESLQGFPPEGISEPFKPIGIQWTERFGVSGGINRAQPADSLQPNQSVVCENFKIGLSSIEPVWGYDELGTAKVSSPVEILDINMYKAGGGTAYLLRVDEDELQYWDGATWTVVTPDTGADMTGDETNTIRSTTVADVFVWTNGKDTPRQWDGGSTFDVVTTDTATGARYCAGFADRLVVADVVTGGVRQPTRLFWSVNGDPTDFSDTGSGDATLYDNQQGYPSDDIMGLTVASDALVILRRHSIWLGLRTGDADAPIQFLSRVQGIGCIAPDSVEPLGSNGVAFLGQNNVYLYSPTEPAPIPIGTPIRDRLFEVLDRTKLAKVRSSYNPTTQEYHLYIPDTVNTWARRAFVFNFERYYQNNEFVWYERTYSHDITAAFGGQVSGFGSTYSDQPRKNVTGGTAGQTYYEDASFTTNDGTAYTCTFRSPWFTPGKNSVQVKRLNVAYRSPNGTAVVSTGLLAGSSQDTGSDSNTFAQTGSYQHLREVNVQSTNLNIDDGFQVYITCAGTADVEIIGYRVGFVIRGPKDRDVY